MVNWFKKAVRKGPPYNLGGWSKRKAPALRRRLAISSRPKNWTLEHKRLSAGRALIALANVTKDRATKIKAISDAKYFFSLLKRRRI